MSISIFCPSCRASLQVEDSAGGTPVACPRCATVSLVPRLGRLADNVAAPAELTPALAEAIRPPQPLATTAPAEPSLSPNREPRVSTGPAPRTSEFGRSARQSRHQRTLAILGGAYALLALLTLALALSIQPAPQAAVQAPPNRKEEDRPPPPPPKKDLPPEINVTVIDKPGENFATNSELRDTDGLDPEWAGYAKGFQFHLEAGGECVVDVRSNAFQPFVRLRHLPRSLRVRSSRPERNTGRLVLEATEPSLVEVLVTSSDKRGTGAFNLSIRRDVALAGLPLADIKLPSPTRDSTKMMAGPGTAVAGVTVRRFEPTPQTNDTWIAGAVWSADEMSLYVLQAGGTLLVLDPATFTARRRLDTGERGARLADSAEGLLVTMRQLGEVWIVDPGSLAVSRRIAVPGVTATITAPGRYALALRGASNAVLLDLREGRSIGRLNFAPDAAALSSDGKWLLAAHGSEWQRYRIVNDKLAHEQSSTLRAKPGKIVISQDSKHACLPNCTATGMGTPVFKIDNLAEPIVDLPTGPHAEAAFDSRRGLIHAMTPGKSLDSYDLDGKSRLHVPLQLERNTFLWQLGFYGRQLLSARTDSVSLVDINAALEAFNPATKLGQLPKGKGFSRFGQQPPRLPISLRPGASMLGERGTIKGLDIQVMFGGNHIWSPDGKHIFFHSDKTVYQARAADHVVTATAELNVHPSWLSICARGLLVTCHNSQRLLLFEPGSFRQLDEVPLTAATRAISAPSLSLAFDWPRASGRPSSFTVVDLVKKNTQTLSADSVIAEPALAPDGKWLYVLETGKVRRFRTAGSSIAPDGEFVDPRMRSTMLHLSGDGRRLVVPCDLRKPGNVPFIELNVFDAELPGKPPLSRVVLDRSPLSMCIDPKTGTMLLLMNVSWLLVIDRNGATIGEYRLGNLSATRLAMHPDGNRLVATSPSYGFVTDFPRPK